MSRDPHDQLVPRIRDAVAAYERTLMTKRVRRDRLRKLRAGTLLPWTRPIQIESNPSTCAIRAGLQSQLESAPISG